MESSVGYDLVTMDLESWPLFGDQSWSSAYVPLLCDIEDTVVQDWISCGATSRNHVQYDGTTSEVLCNSLIADVTTGYTLSGASWPPAEGRKERYPSGDEALKTIMSPGELLYMSLPATSDVDYELSQVVEDPLDVFESEQFGTTESGSAVTDNSNHLTDLQEDIDYLSAQTDASGFFDGGTFQLEAEPYVSTQTFGLFKQLSVTTPTRSEVSIVQEVPPSSREQSLLSLDDIYSTYDVESLTDPANVCNLLLRLSKDADNMSRGSVERMNTEPLLSPMSPEDVESILSVQDEEHSSLGELPLADTQLDILGENYRQSELVSKQLSSGRSPHLESGVPETRRMKKKEQNKTAALRYRQKKREEKGVVISEVDQLQMRNNELKTRVDELNREIKYLRGLLDEIRSS